MAHEKEAPLLSKREIMDRPILDRAEHEEDTGIALLISSHQPEEAGLRVIYEWYANDPQSTNMVTFAWRERYDRK